MGKTIYICDVCKKTDETTTEFNLEITNQFRKDIKFRADLCNICFAVITTDIKKILHKYYIEPKE